MTIKEYIKTRKEELKKEIASMEVVPNFTIVQLNEDDASNAYVRGKLKDAAELGINAKLIKLETSTSEVELLKLIDKLNKDKTVDGFIVQMPLPKQINEETIKLAISPDKDVDGFHPLSKLNPCTPQGIMNYLKHEGVEFLGKNAVVIGRSNIVGRPLADAFINRDATVTLCHSKTKNLEKHTKRADIVVSAVGKPNFLTKDMVRKGFVGIDVGINVVDGKLVGDFSKDCYEKASYMTPVPGGVGPMTVAMIIHNLIELKGMKK